MNNIDNRILVITGVSCLLMVLIGFTALNDGIKQGRELTRQEAVKVGVAHYESNVNGEAVFVWNISSTNKIEK